MKSFGTAQGDRGLIGTEAERLALILQESQAPLLFLVTDGGSITEWWWYGSTAGWVPGQTHVGGAALVSDLSSLPVGIPHIREKLALSTTAVTFDFSATPIKAAKITVTSDDAGVAEFVHAIAYCVDPPNDIIRDAWLAEGDNLTGDTNRLLLKVGGEETLVFKDANGESTTIDYIGVKVDDLGGGTPTVRIVVLGVE